jgi:hypothetical protein
MMAILLELGGAVELWGGWGLTLPPAYYERNPDGSWSSWGADWVIDVNILEVSGDSNGNPIAPELLLGQERTINAQGFGWVGEVKLLSEKNAERDVFRLTAHLAAVNTTISLWVSYFDDSQRPFAEGLVRSVTHGM